MLANRHCFGGKYRRTPVGHDSFAMNNSKARFISEKSTESYKCSRAFSFSHLTSCNGMYFMYLSWHWHTRELHWLWSSGAGEIQICRWHDVLRQLSQSCCVAVRWANHWRMSSLWPVDTACRPSPWSENFFHCTSWNFRAPSSSDKWLPGPSAAGVRLKARYFVTWFA